MRQTKSSTYRKRQPGLQINRKQITVIKLACTTLRIDDATYRQMLHERFGETTCTRLSYDQAGEFIRELESKGFVLTPKKTPASHPAPRKPARKPRPSIPRDRGNVIALASQEEQDKITALAELIQWRVENGLALFLEKRMGISKVRTSAEACRAIEGLKKMFENGMKKQHGVAWWRMAFTDQRIMEYIKQHCPQEWR